jgi:hypothetical protein
VFVHKTCRPFVAGHDGALRPREPVHERHRHRCHARGQRSHDGE